MALAVCAGAPDSVAAQDRGNPDLHVRIVPYLWFSNIDGHNQAGGIELPVHDDGLQTDVAGRVEVGKGRLRGILQLTQGGVANPVPDDAPSGVRGVYDLTITSWELLAAVEIGSFVTSRAIEILGGIRHVRHSQELDLTAPQAASGTFDENWTEPVVGFRYFTEVGGPFWFTIQSDIGGFGIGSDFTWVLDGELGYRLGSHVDLTLRYRYLETQYDNDATGDREYVWDEGQSQGWLVGLAFKP